MTEEDRYVLLDDGEIKDNDCDISFKFSTEELVRKLNESERFRKHHMKKRDELARENELLWDVVQGFLALEGLRSLGYL